jgi:6-pyruvoyltetrahydropterin/6-carboxytetrahydropterin synthase
MILELNGLHAGLRFSSAHIVFGHETCGVIHGHSYYVDVRICGEPSGDFGFVCDFKDIKTIVKEICETLDHKLMLPKNHPHIEYKVNGESIYLKYCGKGKIKEYTLPLEDVVLLPLKSTTAEELSQFFSKCIVDKLEDMGLIDNIKWVEAVVNEGIGQGACYRLNIK